jgi:serine/threonine protein kinase
MILQGLEYLHKNGLIFRDLNCGRIYYNSNNGVVSIGDLFITSEIFYQCFTERDYGNYIYII